MDPVHEFSPTEDDFGINPKTKCCRSCARFRCLDKNGGYIKPTNGEPKLDRVVTSSSDCHELYERVRVNVRTGLQSIFGRMAAHWNRHRGYVFGGVIAVGAGLSFISCATVERTVVVPPEIENATFTGSESCAECHADINRDFKTATHSHLQAKGVHAANLGCESCHGPGSIHKESGGAPRTILNPNRSPETCLKCHLEMHAKFQLPSHHQVMEGKISCTDCHDPHKGQVVPGGARSLLADNEQCYKCHAAQRGPFVYEHEASREGCAVCHDTHGTVNPRLLKERNATLCLKCHFQQQTAGGVVLIGGRDHTAFLGRGTCWTAGCHEAIHGSHVNSSLRF